jgi:hypothetical protein
VEEAAMAGRSRSGVAVGAFIALIVPVSFAVLAQLVVAGIAPYEEMHSLLNLFGFIGWVSLLVLGPVGLAIAGWSVGIRGAMAWLAAIIVVLPLLVVVWFAGVASLSGALGNPA